MLTAIKDVAELMLIAGHAVQPRLVPENAVSTRYTGSAIPHATKIALDENDERQFHALLNLVAMTISAMLARGMPVAQGWAEYVTAAKASRRPVLEPILQHAKDGTTTHNILARVDDDTADGPLASQN